MSWLVSEGFNGGELNISSIILRDPSWFRFTIRATKRGREPTRV